MLSTYRLVVLPVATHVPPPPPIKPPTVRSPVVNVLAVAAGRSLVPPAVAYPVKALDACALVTTTTVRQDDVPQFALKVALAVMELADMLCNCHMVITAEPFVPRVPALVNAPSTLFDTPVLVIPVWAC